MLAIRKPDPILIRRYARNRLYDATHGRYVTVEQLRGCNAGGVAF